MKKIYLLMIGLISIYAEAQITIGKSDIIVSRRKVVQATDTSLRVHASAGANMTWDYSDLNTDIIDSLYFGLPTWYAGNSNFPNSNLALRNYSEANSVTYLKLTDTELSVLGFYEFTDSSEEIFKFNTTIIKFPCTYNSTFNESVTSIGNAIPLGFDPDSTGPIPFLDSIRINFIRKTNAIADGWGTIKTPLGDFPAVKLTNLEIGSQSADMYTSGTWVTVPQAILNLLSLPIPEPDSSYNVNFWTNTANIGYPILTYSYSPREDSSSNAEWLMAAPSFSSLSKSLKQFSSVYPNPISNYLIVNSELELVQIEVYDLQGRLLMSENLEKGNSLDVSSLKSGLYQIKISNPETNQIIGLHQVSKI